MTDIMAPRPSIAPPPPVARAWTRVRIIGHILVGLWILAGLGLIWYLFISFSPDKAAKYGPALLSGVIVTLKLVAISIVLGSTLAVPIAFARMSSNPLFTWPAYAYVYFFRGTPLIAQTFLVYYGAGSFTDELKSANLWWFFREAWYCVVLTFTLNTAAYQAEIMRGAMQSVPVGQREAAKSLGLSPWITFTRIIVPQAMIIALRPLGNEIILMIKGSAIASIVTVFDLMGETRRAFSRTFDYQMYLWAGVFYLVMVEALRQVWERLEASLTKHLKRSD